MIIEQDKLERGAVAKPASENCEDLNSFSLLVAFSSPSDGPKQPYPMFCSLYVDTDRLGPQEG